MIIKKYTGGAWVAQSPKVTYTDIVADVTAGTPTSIFESGKLGLTYLPDAVFGGMKFVGTVGYNSNATDTLEKLIQGGSTNWTISSSLDSFTSKSYSNGDYAGIGQRYIGYYWVVQNSVTLTVSDSAGGAADFADEATDDGTDQSTSAPYAIGVEHGDWLIITGWDNTNSKFLISVVNNTYSTAGSGSQGVIAIGYSENGKNYPVELDSNSKAFVNVPWDDVSTANVRTAGALMDDELTSLSGVKTLTVPDSTTISTFGASLVDDTSAGAALTTLGVSSFAQTILDDANAAAVLTTLGVDTDVASLSLPANTTISTFGSTLIDDADAAAARTTLGVDAAGTDNSTDVTLAGSYDYLTISGQVITRNQVDYATDISNKPTASDGLELDGDNFEMVYPLYVASSDPTGTIKDDAIAFVG